MIGAVLLSLHLITDLAAGLSACDDIDIFFLIDKESLVNDYHTVSSMVTSIIEDGSSEDSAYSLLLYGEELTDNDLSLELHLLDTFHTHRFDKSDIISKRLQQIYNNLTVPNAGEAQATRDVSLAQAFNAATRQPQPPREYHKKNRFSHPKYAAHGIGQADDENRFFIFDYHNQLLDTNGDGEICELFKYVGEHDAESIHFFMGQDYGHQTIENTVNTICSADIPFHDDLFFYIDSAHHDREWTDSADSAHVPKDDDDDDYLQDFERIFHLSCPAKMLHPYADGTFGSVHLTAHNQWMDPHKVLYCHLEHVDHSKHEDAYDKFKHELNAEESYIYVSHNVNDKNTYKVGDTLLADEDTHIALLNRGCDDPLYKIVSIETVTDPKLIERFSNDARVHSQMLKIYVGSHESIMEYILEADVKWERRPAGTYQVTPDKVESEMKDIHGLGDLDEFVASSEESDEFYRGYDSDSKDSGIDKRLLRRGLWDDMQGTTITAQTPLIHKKKKPAVSFMDPYQKRKFSELTKGESDQALIYLPQMSSVADAEYTDPSSEGDHVVFTNPEHMRKKSMYAKLRSKFRKSKGYVVLEDWAKEDGLKADYEADHWVGKENKVEHKKPVAKFGWATEFPPKKGPQDLKWIESKKTLKIGLFKAEMVGKIKAKFAVSIKLIVEFKGEVKWKNLFKKDSEAAFKFTAFGTVHAHAEALFWFKAQLTLTATYKIAKTIIIPATIVPVIITPYFKLEVKIEFPKFEFLFKAIAKYKQEVRMIYEYGGKKDKKDSKDSKDSKDKKATKIEETWTADTSSARVEKDEPTEHELKYDARLSVGSASPCVFDLDITFTITPLIGCRLYGALGVEVTVPIKIPYGYRMTITKDAPIPEDPSKCVNVGTAICKDQDIKTVPFLFLPHFEVKLSITGEAFVKLPNFANLIKQVFALKKLFSKVKADVIEFQKTIHGALKELEELRKIMGLIKTALEEIKTGKERSDALDVLSVNVEELQKWWDTNGNDSKYTKWKKRIERRLWALTKIYNDMLVTLKRPFDMKKSGAKITAVDEYVVVADTHKPGDCKKPLDQPSPFSWFYLKTKALIRKGCCAHLKIPIAAHSGFEDWYEGYDEYDQQSQHSEHTRYDIGHSRSKQQLNSVPIVRSRYTNNDNSIMALVFVNAFVLVVIACMVGCVCLLCGAVGSYQYYTRSQGKVYNRLSVNEENEEEERI